MILSLVTYDCKDQIFAVWPMFSGGVWRFSGNERSHAGQSPCQELHVQVLWKGKIVLNQNYISETDLSTVCITNIKYKHRKNCECCPCHSLFKGHKVIVSIVVLNCQHCNQCLKCQASGHKIFRRSKSKLSSKIVVKNC